MLKNKNIRWFYGLGVAFILLCVTAFAFEFYWIALLPLAFLTFYTLVFHTDKLIYFIAFTTPLSIPLNDLAGGLSLSVPTEPLIILLFMGFIFKLLKGQKVSKQFLKQPLTILLFATLFLLIATSLTSTMPIISAKYTLSYAWYIFVIYFIVGHLFRRKKVIKTFLWCMTIASTILVLYTLKNHAAEGFSRYYSYTAMRPFIPDHGMYGAAISFFIPVGFVFTLYGHKLKISFAAQIFSFFLTTLITIGVIFSFTRASWLSLVVAFGVYGLLLLKIRFKTIVSIGILGIVTFIAMQGSIWQELTRNKQDSDDDLEDHVQSVTNVSTDPSNLERLNRWSCAYRMFLDKPFYGFGPGTFTNQYAPYQISGEMSIISTNSGDLGNVHSEFLRPLAESGLLGGLAFLLLAILAIQQGFYIFYHANDPEVKYLALAVLLGLITYLTHGLINNYSEFDKIAVPLYGFLAVLSALKSFHMKGKIKM